MGVSVRGSPSQYNLLLTDANRSHRIPGCHHVGKPGCHNVFHGMDVARAENNENVYASNPGLLFRNEKEEIDRSEIICEREGFMQVDVPRIELEKMDKEEFEC